MSTPDVVPAESTPSPLPRQPIPGLAWYDIEDPGSPALDELARRYRLHELQIEDCRHPHQRVKIEEHEEYVFCVLKALRPNERFHDLDVFVGADFLITVHTSERELIERVRRRAAEGKVQRLDRVLHMLADQIVDEYMASLEKLGDEITRVENEALHRPEPPVLRLIFRLKRRLLEFRRVAGGMREVVNTILRRQGGLIGHDLDPYFRDVYDHLVRMLDLTETYRDLLTGSLDVYLSSVANRTNQVMKVLTIYGTIALPLVIITGFFGMNLRLPWGEEHPHGAFYAVGLMALAVLSVLLYLRRKKVL
jgi:magnesium transporter